MGTLEDSVRDISSRIFFLSGLVRNMNGFVLKDNLDPNECLYKADVLVDQGKTKMALSILEECWYGIEATLTVFLRGSPKHLYGRLHSFKEEVGAFLDKDIFQEIGNALREEELYVSEQQLDLEKCVATYRKCFFILELCKREQLRRSLEKMDNIEQAYPFLQRSFVFTLSSEKTFHEKCERLLLKAHIEKLGKAISVLGR